MTPKPRISAPLVVFILTFALPFAGGGCTKQACLLWNEADGACPSQAEAITFFDQVGCAPHVESVDSEPEFDGELCCYDVTEGDSTCGGLGH